MIEVKITFDIKRVGLNEAGHVLYEGYDTELKRLARALDLTVKDNDDGTSVIRDEFGEFAGAIYYSANGVWRMALSKNPEA